MSQELGVTVNKQNDIHEWYRQIVMKAGLADYGPVQGTMIVKPYGMKLWNSIKSEFQGKIEDEVDNAYFPLFIPKRLLDKEEDIVDGFGAEVAYVEDDSEKDIEERVAIRPTSESIVTDFFSDEIRSHRQLPYRLNQWANVVRWEVSDTRPFLRTREFLWQEGHTVHETHEGAEREARKHLKQYEEVVEDHLAIPSVLGYKPEHDKFPGADYTYTIETLMPDGRSIQSGTSHNLGQHFTEAFDVTYEDENSDEKTAYTTSWGISTRLIGSLILAHGDDEGLRLPPTIAPIQAVIVPIYQDDNREEVLESSEDTESKLEGIRTKVDDRDHRTPGYKFNEWELKGVPLRIEIGPDEAESGTATMVRRDTGDREEVEVSDLNTRVNELMDEIQEGLYRELERYQEDNIRTAESKEDILGTIGRSRGYVRARWCGSESCEAEIKDEVAAEIVVLPFSEDSAPETVQGEPTIQGECAVCGEDASKWAWYAKNY
ncbi:proline--tRNA ligase [Nanohaloarchaea archaeon]|nr:proline--tRNA ligase [Candidatus Nanohaloarchaea archaeon]